jgi:acetoin:2,6-dichlorophenolindophenol oxidoreductase subunit alpha
MTSVNPNEAARHLALLRTMLRIRRFEEVAETAQRAGEIPGTLHLSIGQEGVAAGICSALERTDLITSTHRGHGHSIAKGAPLAAMMAELFGRTGGSCHGKGGSMHVADFAVGMLGANGVVGGGIGIAVGAAQGLRVRGSNAVVASFFGDGAANRGPFLEGLNWAAIFNLPVLFVCEDNGFAAFTRTARLTAGKGPAARAEALGIVSATVDGNDAIAVADLAATFVEHLRRGQGPRLIHALTYRLRGHTIADKGTYRDAAEHARREALDPIPLLWRRLTEAGVEDEAKSVAAKVEAEIAEALEMARASPFPDPGQALADVQDAGAPV